MGIMAFGQRQILHIGIEIAVALGTAVLGIAEDDVAWSAGKRVSQVMQSASDGPKPVGPVLAQRTCSPLIVAAASDNFRLGQILNTGYSFGLIC